MEEVLSDPLGLFEVEIVEDDEFVYYGGLKSSIVPTVCFQTTGRLIADVCMWEGKVCKGSCVFQGPRVTGNSEIIRY